MIKNNNFYFSNNKLHLMSKQNINFHIPNGHENDLIKKLPLYTKFDEISNTVSNCMITVIYSNNCTGKTIGVPYCLSNNLQLKGNIFCSVPTIAATISSYYYQSKLFDKLNNSVGFAYNDKINHNNDTSKITYCTYSYLLNKLIHAVSDISNKNPWFCSVIILDDFQSRKNDLQVCLCLWIYYYNMWKKHPSIAKPPKLVIMTSVADNSIVQMLPTKPSVLSYIFQTPIITTIYDNESEKIGLGSKSRCLRTADIVYRHHIDDANIKGSYLIFLPNNDDIEMVVSVLKKKFIRNTDIIMLHNDSIESQLQKVYNPIFSDVNRRKIILATSDLQYSLTIENITLVVDSLQKTRTTNNADFCWITMADSLQRKSRISPSQEAKYIVLQSSNNYSKLVEKNDSEIINVTMNNFMLNYYVLELIKHSLNPKFILAPIINETEIIACCELLKKLGFYKNNFIITDIGIFCSQFPFDIRKAAIIYYLYKSKSQNIFLYLAVICTLECYGSGFFVWPRKRSNEDILSYSMRCDDAIEKFENKFGGYSDIDTLFKIWTDVCLNINPFYITDLKLYCRKNHLNLKCFKESVTLIKKCMHISNHNYYKIVINQNTEPLKMINFEELSNTFYRLLVLTHHDYETTIIHKPNGNTIAVCNGIEYKIDRKAVHLMNVGNSPNKIYYSLVKTQKNTNKGTIRIINVLHAVFDDETDNINIFMSESDIEQEINILSDDDIIINDNWNNFFSDCDLFDYAQSI
jgi:HrpA-like RNA helicase